MILETERLCLREMTPEDWPALAEILQDPQAMYAYEHAFSDDEVTAWLTRQMERYTCDGFGLWAMIEKETGRMMGQMGITLQDWNGRRVPEVGYLLNRDFWHRGYAAEGAVACKKLAFETYGFPVVYSIIRDSNTASQRVARRNGMAPRGVVLKHYYDMDMPHIVFGAVNPDYCFRPADWEEKEQIFALFRRAVVYGRENGNPVWGDDYPRMEFVERDILNGSQYVLTFKGGLAGAVSCLEQDDLDSFSVSWTRGRSAKLMRLCSAPGLRGRGIGAELERRFCETAKLRGFESIRLLAAADNAPALRLYRACGYVQKGIVHHYDMDFHCLEKLL